MLALPIASIHPAAAAVLWVTNDGADSSSCGSQATPCRSISQGIENASDGDTIEVGAGHYGNVSGNVNYTGPGDEHPQATPGCIVCITKGLSIYSVHGAAATVIDSLPSTPFGTTVMILSDGVHFGQAGGGFTLTGGNARGLAIDQNAQGYGGSLGIILKRNITVAGNVDVGDANGFVFNGWVFEDTHCPNPICISTAQITFSDNESLNNGAAAFNVTVNTYNPPIILQSNLARGAGTGFLVTQGGQDEVGLQLGMGNVAVLGNVALRNSVGFFLTLIARTEDNTAAGNSQTGFWVFPSGTFRGNSALGNGGPGVLTNFSANYVNFGPLTNNYSSFSQNNFYGNDRNRPALNISVGPIPAPNPGPSADCGVLNVGDVVAAEQGTPLQTVTLQAGGSFWGSAQGPAPTGIGDAVGGACDQNGGVTIAKPFATTALPITSLP